MFRDDVDFPPAKSAWHECPTYKKVFAQPDKLKRHRDTYIKEKKFQCSKCDKSFHHKSDLKHHDKQVHEKQATQREYKCATCGERFHNLAPFKSHQETHSKHSSKTAKRPRDRESGILVRISRKFYLHETIHEICLMQIRDESSEVKHRISHMLILSITTASSICVPKWNCHSISLNA